MTEGCVTDYAVYGNLYPFMHSLTIAVMSSDRLDVTRPDMVLVSALDSFGAVTLRHNCAGTTPHLA